MGTLPDWYAAVRASKYVGSVAPWEWDDAPLFWLDATLTAESAEARAEQDKQDRANKAGKRSTARRR